MNTRVLFNLSMVVLFAFAFVGCEETNIDLDQSKVSNTDLSIIKRDIPTGYTFSWRFGKPDITYPNLCLKGCGMCYMFVEKIDVDLELPPDVQSTPILTGEYGNNYVEVLVNDDLAFNDDEQNLYIEDNIEAKTSDGQIYTLEAGVYPINYELGDLGGYILPLQN